MPRKPYNDKPRSDSWDTPLTEAQRWQAYDKFVQFRAKWWEVSAWVEAEFRIKAPSRSGLYRFWERMKKDEAAWRTRQCIEAKARAGELAKHAGQNDAELAAAYQTLAADAALQMHDVDRAMKLTTMAMVIGAKISKRKDLEIKERAQTVKEEALCLQREKFEAAESRLQAVRDALAAPKAADGGLSPETLKKIEEAAGLL